MAYFTFMFGNNVACSLCEEVNSIESESHLLNCSFPKKDKVLENKMQQVSYFDVFSDKDKHIKIVNVFKQVMKIFENVKK